MQDLGIYKPFKAMAIGAVAVMILTPVAGFFTGLVHAERMGGPGLHVYDGDTFSIGSVRYRVAGIDAPEIGGRARCKAERDRGELARDEARRYMDRPYRLETLARREKYGRTLVRVTLSDGTDLGQRLILQGLAVPYEGRGKRKDWCNDAG